MADSKRTLLERIDRNVMGAVNVLVQIREDLREIVKVGHQTLNLTQQTKAGITMANQAITELTQQFNVATNNIAARIERLTQGLGDQVSAEQLAELTAIKDTLAALGQDPNNPVPNPVV